MQIEQQISEALGISVTITTREGEHRARRHSSLVMPKDPTIAIRDCLAEIAVCWGAYVAVYVGDDRAIHVLIGAKRALPRPLLS